MTETEHFTAFSLLDKLDRIHTTGASGVERLLQISLLDGASLTCGRGQGACKVLRLAKFLISSVP